MKDNAQMEEEERREGNANNGKTDALFKDRDPRKPYPIGRHIPMKPIYGSTARSSSSRDDK